MKVDELKKKKITTLTRLEGEQSPGTNVGKQPFLPKFWKKVASPTHILLRKNI